MTYTTSYQLPQWVDSDRILRTDFNDAFQKLETALAGLDSQIDALDTQVDAKGNCVIYTTTYVGTGGYGSSSKTTVTCPGEPLAVFVAACGDNGLFMVALRGAPHTYAQASGSVRNYLSWGTNSLSWYSSDSATGQFNLSGLSYRVVALLTV